MKNLIFVVLTLIFTNSMSGQVTEIQCLGESWSKQYNDGKTESKENKQVGTIFSINEKDSIINVKTSTRYGTYNDKFRIIKFLQTEKGKNYQCEKNNDNVEYVISVKEKYVEMIFGNSNSTSVIRSFISRIINRK